MERNRSERGNRDTGRGNARDAVSTRNPARDTGRGNTDRGSTRGASTRFEYHKPTAEAVKKRSEQRGGNEFDSIFKSAVKVFKVKDSNVLRLLPPTWEKPKHFGFDIFMHYSIGADSQSYLCPKEMLDKPCPICEARALAVKDGDDDYAKELKAGKRVIYYIIDRDEEKEGVQAWAAPWTVDRDINTLIVDKRSGEVLGIDDPENGYDIEFSRTGKALTTKYVGMQIARRESDLGDDKWLEFAVNNPLPEQLQYFDYDHIAKVFGGQSSKKDKEENFDDKQDRELRDGAERSTRGSKDSDADDLTFESVHGMVYEELCAIIDSEKLDIEPKDSTNDTELADWISEDLKLTKKEVKEESTRHASREPAVKEESPRDKLRNMRRDRE